MRSKLVTNHKTHAFIFHTSHHITEFISYQTKNSTTQPNNRNHVRIRKLTQKKKKKFRERTQRGGRWLGKPRKFHSHGLTVSGDRSEREECWLGVDGGVDVEAHGGAEWEWGRKGGWEGGDDDAGRWDRETLIVMGLMAWVSISQAVFSLHVRGRNLGVALSLHGRKRERGKKKKKKKQRDVRE